MAKDYTDYVALILEAEKRVYHIYHFRAKLTNEQEAIQHNGREYLFDRDRAFRVRWAPWKKWFMNKPLWSLNECIRGKKIGLLLYHEPLSSSPDMVEEKHEVITGYACNICPFTTKDERAAKGHVSRKHKGAKFDMVIVPEKEVEVGLVPSFPRILPIHISRMHQPSGELRP